MNDTPLSIAPPDAAADPESLKIDPAGRLSAWIGMSVGPIQGIALTVGMMVDLTFYAAMAVALGLLTGLIINGAGVVMALSARSRGSHDRPTRIGLWTNGLAFGLVLLTTLVVVVFDPMGPHLGG